MQCNIPLIGLWNVWPQDLQLSVPMLVLRSNLTVTPVSWLQKTHLKAVGRGSARVGYTEVIADFSRNDRCDRARHPDEPAHRREQASHKSARLGRRQQSGNQTTH